MVASAADTGRVGVIVPNGVLFREGKELPIRRGIIEANLLEAVIALPTNLFYNTSVPCAIIILNKSSS